MRKLAWLGLGSLLVLWPVACGDDDAPGDGNSGGSSGTGGSGGSTSDGGSNPSAGTSSAGTNNAGTSSGGAGDTGGSSSGGAGGSAGSETGGTTADPDAGMDMDAGETLMGRFADCATICATHAVVAAAGVNCEVVDDCENGQCTFDDLFPGDCAAEYDAYLTCLAAAGASGYECVDDDGDANTPMHVNPTAETCLTEQFTWFGCEGLL